MQHDPQNSPSAPERSGRRGSQWPKLLGCGCLGLVLILGLVAVGVYRFLSVGQHEVAQAVESFLDLAESGQLEAAYDEAGDAWRAAQSLTDMQSFVESHQEALGPRRELWLTSARLEATTDGTEVVANFAARYTKGDATMIVTLRRYDGQWKVDGLHVHSDLVMEALSR